LDAWFDDGYQAGLDHAVTAILAKMKANDDRHELILLAELLADIREDEDD
jgi:hypothetical protein